MKFSIIYYSRSGNTKRMAERIAQGAGKVSGVEAKLFELDAIDDAFLEESKVVVLGTPTYLASMAGPVKTWLDGAPRKYKLAGKLAGAFATEDYIHGGGDIAVQAILSHFMVLGTLVYSGGGAHGKPVIHLGPVALGKDIENYDECFTLYGERMATKAKELFG